MSICALCGRYSHRDELVALEYQTDPRLMGYVKRWMCLGCLELQNKRRKLLRLEIGALEQRGHLTWREKVKQRRLVSIEQALEKISA